MGRVFLSEFCTTAMGYLCTPPISFTCTVLKVCELIWFQRCKSLYFLRDMCAWRQMSRWMSPGRLIRCCCTLCHPYFHNYQVSFNFLGPQEITFHSIFHLVSSVTENESVCQVGFKKYRWCTSFLEIFSLHLPFCSGERGNEGLCVCR